jgi:cytidylate kinase
MKPVECSDVDRKVDQIMNVITISRQLGSLGCEVANAVAGQLNYRLVWRELINEAALRAGAPDVALATIDELGLLGIAPSPSGHKAYIDAVRTVMEELSSDGKVVIVGRAGQMILHGRPNVLHVQVVAPIDVRIERISQKQEIPVEAARAQVEASDAHRRKYLKRFYRVDWGDSTLYDLTVNTARMTPKAAAELICFRSKL